MKKNNYPKYDEKHSGMMAADPIVGTAYAIPQRTKSISQKTRSIYQLPESVPHTAEDAIADIEAGELEFVRGKTFSHKKVMQMIWEKIDGYAS